MADTLRFCLCTVPLSSWCGTWIPRLPCPLRSVSSRTRPSVWNVAASWRPSVPEENKLLGPCPYPWAICSLLERDETSWAICSLLERDETSWAICSLLERDETSWAICSLLERDETSWAICSLLWNFLGHMFPTWEGETSWAICSLWMKLLGPYVPYLRGMKLLGPYVPYLRGMKLLGPYVPYLRGMKLLGPYVPYLRGMKLLGPYVPYLRGMNVTWCTSVQLVYLGSPSLSWVFIFWCSLELSVVFEPACVMILSKHYLQPWLLQCLDPRQVSPKS